MPGGTDTVIEPREDVVQLTLVEVAVAPSEEVLFTVMISSFTSKVAGSLQDEYVVLTINCSDDPVGQTLGKITFNKPAVVVFVSAVATKVPLMVSNWALTNLDAPPEGTNR